MRSVEQPWPPALAALAFDAAVHDGASRAKIWMQAAAAVAEDGDLGDETMGAIGRLGATPVGVAQLCCEFQARRVDFEGLLPTWKLYGLGWSRRLCSVLSQSLAHWSPVAAGV